MRWFRNLTITVILVGLAYSNVFTADPIPATSTGFNGDGSSSSYDTYFYWPWSNNPPGAPPNYNLVDNNYFKGVPALPAPLTNNAGGYYIYEDTAAGKWYLANFLYSKGKSLEQFHGSILVTMDQPPAPNVNIWSEGFELSTDLKQNDRWGWVKWPDSIAPNLYEIWWDITIDYAKKKDTGDFRDTLGIEVSGCAIDFNIWSSGHNNPFSADQIYLGANMVPLSTVPGFSDTYSGITDQYQMGNPEKDPNTSRFSPKSLLGASYNKNGMISTGSIYGDRYAGTWAYEGNGVQFATLFCPVQFPPNFVQCEDEDEDDDGDDDDEEDDDDHDDDDDEDEDNCDRTYAVCFGSSIVDTIKATDPNSSDTLTVSILSGAGTLNVTSGTTPVIGIYELFPDTTGLYTVQFLVDDGNGGADTMEVIYSVTVDAPPVVILPSDTTVDLCTPLELCFPLDLYDLACNITSITTNLGQYSGDEFSFDQIGRLDDLGGSVFQIGGGDPGKQLFSSSDFVPPVNSQSGVSVFLPNFVFVHEIEDYGTFPSGITPGNSADHLVGSPTDMTYTTPGFGGPDGGDGDGSVGFVAGDYTIIEFEDSSSSDEHDITTCSGSKVDLFVFTSTDGGGLMELIFLDNGDTVHTLTAVLNGGTAGSGSGGATFDLPDGISYDRVKIKCLSGQFEIDALAARVAGSSSNTDICFTPDTSGVYELIASATDLCGNSTADTMLVTVNLNSAPVASAGPDQSLFVCDFSQVCLPVSFSDAENNISIAELFSGPGTLTGNQICFTPTSAGAYTFILRAVDACGLEDYDTVVVTIDANDAPVANVPNAQTLFLCDTSQVCYTFTATDPNGGPLTWTFNGGVGSISPSGDFCFTPTASGTYASSVIVSDSCGIADTVSISYNITVNSAPVAVDPASPVVIAQCTPAEICYQFTANDVNAGSMSWSLLSGSGTISTSGLWCFTPTSSGSFSAQVVVADSCGAVDTTSLTYNITVNGPPTVILEADRSDTLCTSSELCLIYSVSDPNGSSQLTEEMVSGFGTIDTLNNKICFTPVSDGTYQFVVQVTDSCGETALDSSTITVVFDSLALISCPSQAIPVSLCSPDTICQTLDISPSNASVTVSNGVYQNGELCLFADTSGLYSVTVIADAACGADTCTIIFDVSIGQAAQISCPPAQSVTLCQADSIFVPVGIIGPGATVNVGPIGSYSSGTLAFMADTAGHYVIEMIASTFCGTDTCLVVVDVALNSNPIASVPPPWVDTSLCAATGVCYQFLAIDLDGGPLVWSRVSGDGTVSDSGLWCLNPSASGTFSVVAAVTDSCGASDTVSMTMNIIINTAPLFSFGNDTSAFMCDNSPKCFPYTYSDAENNIESINLISGPGTLDLANKLLCFTPPSAGNYQFIVVVTDSCGASVTDTLNVTAEFNVAPVADAGADQTLFQCSPQQICIPGSATDANGNLATLELVSGLGTFDGTNICFTPSASGLYQFVLRATDDCGAEGFDTVLVDYSLNSLPIADAGPDQSFFLCQPDTICVTTSCDDPDGNLSDCVLTSGSGSYDGANICFVPTSSGTYQFVIQANDACGGSDVDTVNINVTINSAPVTTVPNDSTIFLCTLQQVCLPAFGTDTDGNLSLTQIISGPGTLSGGNWCYTPVASQTVNVTVRSVDSCGAADTASFAIEFGVNEDPIVDLGPDSDTTLCTSSLLCLPYTAHDPNTGQPVVLTLVQGVGSIDTLLSSICFTPDTSGLYQFILRVDDPCGSFDVDTLLANVTINNAPVADAGPDQTLFLCDDTTTICWPVSCSDVDGNLTDCMFSSTVAANYNSTDICFNPTASGTYLFVLEAVDACGVSSLDTSTIQVTINSAPTVSLGPDQNTTFCDPTEICLGYSVNDVDGISGVTEAMVAGFGVIDTALNQICFTPTTVGSYEFIVSATDSCGATTSDTIVYTVDLKPQVAIDCPAGPIDVSLCSPNTVCTMLPVSPAGAVVTTSFGSWSNDSLCFFADTSGTYLVEVIASDSCGADTCNLTFNVVIDTTTPLTCPPPTNAFLCSADTVCIPLNAGGGGVTVSVSPIGTYQAGNICFPADTSGHYELEVIATSSCRTDTCLVIADIVVNSLPVAQPVPVVDTFLCAPYQLCRQLTATDADNNIDQWRRISGDGTISSSGLWCYDVTASGSYSVQAEVIDSCGGADTVTATYNISLNTSPIVILPGDVTPLLCGSEAYCFNYTVADAQNNVILEQLIMGDPSTIVDTATNQICFTPPDTGTYMFVLEVTDACGATDLDTTIITIEFNSPPIAAIGIDTTGFECGVFEFCRDAAGFDIDGNLDSVYLVSGPGIFDGTEVCFSPDTSGVYTLILRAVDDCGLFDEDTAHITFDMNSPPVCDLPQGTPTFFQCQPTEVSLPVGATDIDGNYDHSELLTGPGSIVGSLWTYKPSTDELVTVSVMCLDSCGAASIDSFTVQFDINSPPVVDLGSSFTVFACSDTTICVDVIVTDADGNLQLVEAGAGSDGTYDPITGKICVNTVLTTGSQDYTVIIDATDSCGATTTNSLTFTVDFNSPPDINIPPDFTAFLETSGQICFLTDVSDTDNNLLSVVVSPSMGVYDAINNEICFTPPNAGDYCFVITATDDCGAITVDSVCVTVDIDQCILVQIEEVETLQGQYTDVDILLTGGGYEMGGFDFLISYDATALNVGQVTMGSLLDSCGWEYFQYRYGYNGNCSACPSGLLFITAIAETNNGIAHPGCYLNNMTGTLATLQFLVSNDRTLECQRVPIDFFWITCIDNVVSSINGDTLWMSRDVYTDNLLNIADNSYGLPGIFGAPDICLLGGGQGKPAPERCVDFTNGGIKIICADSIDARGDINLNGLSYEISDAVIYSNYFIDGLSAFGTGMRVQGSIAASDVNADGLPLTVADLVYLIRVVVGDTPPMPKVNPSAEKLTAVFSVVDQKLLLDLSDSPVGAIFILLEGDIHPSLSSEAYSMEMRYRFDGTDTRVLIYNTEGSKFLTTGPILQFDQQVNVRTLEVGSFDGSVVTAKISNLPREFELAQNYPNPFNPTTTIEFALPVASEWSVSVYNVLGQTVESFGGEYDAGFYKIEWVASRYASGVYFYRLVADDFISTKKMVLLK